MAMIDGFSKRFELFFRLALVCALVNLNAWVSNAADRPNIIYLLADDLGYAELAGTSYLRIHLLPILDVFAQFGVF